VLIAADSGGMLGQLGQRWISTCLRGNASRMTVVGHGGGRSEVFEYVYVLRDRDEEM
jgi:hypothetical protein